MKLRIVVIASLCLFIASGFLTSKTFVSTSQDKRINQVNEELTDKMVKIRFDEGREIKGHDAQLTSDSLFYSKSNMEKGVPLDTLKSIRTSPGIGVSEIIGIPLFAFGTYLFSRLMPKQTCTKGCESFGEE